MGKIDENKRLKMIKMQANLRFYEIKEIKLLVAIKRY
jgi:hypothetical protein